ncbi:hypothetical protein K0A97_03110 [Patescibacteria group bacterium]|nr:hypothetical protein [Patescibacteria group bacterium]
MKKKNLLYLSTLGFIILIFLIYSTSLYFLGSKTNSLEKEKITGKITQGELAIAISVILTPPSLEIIKPKNGTYLTKIDLPLEFISNGITFMYNLDQNSNITLEEGIKFNVTEDDKTYALYLFANNSEGTTTKNVTFSVNSTKFRIDYKNYKDRGSSTDFNKSTFEEIQEIENVVLENPGFGKIYFDEPLNLTNISGNVLDLDSYTNVSFNNVFINTTILNNLNKSATVYLYNLNLNNPRILKDGNPCPSSICTIISNSPQVFIFSVNQFTRYSAEDVPTSPPSGGGGGSSFIVIPKPPEIFWVSVSNLEVKLTQGETKVYPIVLTNLQQEPLTFSISSEDLERFIDIPESYFTLEANESKALRIQFSADENILPELYLGKIIIQSGEIKKEIPVKVEIESSNTLLDIYLEIEPKEKKIYPGESLFLNLELFNLGEKTENKADLEYQIRDEENKILLRFIEQITIGDQKSLVKGVWLDIPREIKPGMYIVYVKATVDGKVASASSVFEIKRRGISFSSPIIKQILYGISLVLLFVIVYFIVKVFKRIFKKKKMYRNPNSKKIREKFSGLPPNNFSKESFKE